MPSQDAVDVMPDPGHRPLLGVARWVDLALAGALIVGAALATTMPSSAGRVLLTLPALMFIPGYLLVQAVSRPGEGPTVFRGLVAIGLSPPLVGALALTTAAVPGAFRAGPIIAVVTAACLLLAAVAFVRRGRQAAPVATPAP